MTEYSKQIFQNPELLRQKLNLYLQTPKKTELYAKACEKFYSSQKENIEWQFSWSWWAFFFPFLFLLSRKHYIAAFVALFTINIFLLFAHVFYAMWAKYFVVKRFVKFLDLQDDEILLKKGGKNSVVIIVLIVFLLGILASISISSYMQYTNNSKRHYQI